MPGLLLRLAGPLQSWGSQSRFSLRDTGAYPTRSGLLGILGAAAGVGREERDEDLTGLDFTVRVDRPGVRTLDYHTIGGGLPREWTVPTAEGGRRVKEKATIVTKRHYLADAVFVVAVTGEEATLERFGRALTGPVWQPYLGRRSCPPEQPLVLGGVRADAVAELRRVPLARRKPPRDIDFVDVDVIGSAPSPEAVRQPARTSIADDPGETVNGERQFRGRDMHVSPLRLPSRLCAGTGTGYLDSLAAYLDGTR